MGMVTGLDALPRDLAMASTCSAHPLDLFHLSVVDGKLRWINDLQSAISSFKPGGVVLESVEDILQCLHLDRGG